MGCFVGRLLIFLTLFNILLLAKTGCVAGKDRMCPLRRIWVSVASDLGISCVGSGYQLHRICLPVASDNVKNTCDKSIIEYQKVTK